MALGTTHLRSGPCWRFCEVGFNCLRSEKIGFGEFGGICHSFHRVTLAVGIARHRIGGDGIYVPIVHIPIRPDNDGVPVEFGRLAHDWPLSTWAAAHHAPIMIPALMLSHETST